MEKSKKIISEYRILQHILYWCVSYYYLIHFFSITNNIETIDYIYTAVFHITIVLAVYVNLFVLVPRLLGRKKYLLFVLCVIALLAITAWLNSFIYNYAIDFFLPNYFFVSNFSFWQLVQFGFVYVAITTLLKLSRAWFKLLESQNHLIRLEKEKANTELLFLKMQINPHFLFNSLNNIYSLALKKDTMAPTSILKLAEVMRYMIYESNENAVPLQKEIEYLNNYIDLQKLRTRDNASVVCNITGEPANRYIAPLILLVFIENGFKHGIKATIHQSYVNIQINITDEQLQMRVENSKGVIDEVEKDANRGLGLENVKRRLELLYPGKYELTIHDTDKKYLAVLQLPLQKRNNQ
ncbi:MULTISPECIES: sensor histidine kinase [Niastella]|uniref:Histidine kinase n=1 Tax=Niastella soli TaxID=2821487 RepID=A0ABS3Z3Q2_9BACT|nr:histidine kinase [Niastella soli]MBO9204770.1 histidine kinase [Niastella soli]